MTTLAQLKYEDEFYFEGVRFKQVIRPKWKLSKKDTVFCHTKIYPWKEVNFSVTVNVKPVIKAKKMIQANAKQKEFLDNITELVNDIGCGFLYGEEFEGWTNIDRHHIAGKSYKHNKIHIGCDFVIPVPKPLHEVLSNHPENVTNFKKRFTGRFGMQRELYGKLIEKMREYGYPVPSMNILNAINCTSY